jgi:hypothetical protein
MAWATTSPRLSWVVSSVERPIVSGVAEGKESLFSSDPDEAIGIGHSHRCVRPRWCYPRQSRRGASEHTINTTWSKALSSEIFRLCVAWNT